LDKLHNEHEAVRASGVDLLHHVQEAGRELEQLHETHMKTQGELEESRGEAARLHKVLAAVEVMICSQVYLFDNSCVFILRGRCLWRRSCMAS
jgi:hypothetical protein